MVRNTFSSRDLKSAVEWAGDVSTAFAGMTKNRPRSDLIS
jgi:hypothetical protein